MEGESYQLSKDGVHTRFLLRPAHAAGQPQQRACEDGLAYLQKMAVSWHSSHQSCIVHRWSTYERPPRQSISAHGSLQKCRLSIGVSCAATGGMWEGAQWLLAEGCRFARLAPVVI